jgi:hypothetical protein
MVQFHGFYKELYVRFIILATVFVWIGDSNAIDYSLCSSYLKKKSYAAWFEIDDSGNIKRGETLGLDVYRESQDKKTFNLVKVIKDKDIKSAPANVIKIIEVTVEVQEGGGFDIRQVTRVNHSDLASSPVHLMGFIHMGRHYLSPSFIKPNEARTLREELESKLRVRNGKCYPEGVSHTLSDYPDMQKQGKQYSAGYSSSSKKCRDILDFYKNNPLIKNCTEAKSLKKLKAILGFIPDEKKFYNDKLIDELDESLGLVQRLLILSEKELTGCNNHGLDEAVLDKSLWKNQTHPTKSKERSTTMQVE